MPISRSTVVRINRHFICWCGPSLRPATAPGSLTLVDAGAMDGLMLAHHTRRNWPWIDLIVTSGWVAGGLEHYPQIPGFSENPMISPSSQSTFDGLGSLTRLIGWPC